MRMNETIGRRGMVALMAALIAVSASGCTEVIELPSNGYAGDAAVTEIAEADRGEPIDFVTEDAEGNAVAAEELRGQVVVLNFWYAACAPCRIEAPVLETLHTEFAEDVAFFGVNSRDTKETASSFTESYGVTYPSILDADEKNVTIAVSAKIPVKATPTTVILDREGRVQAVILGQVDESITRTLLEDAVAA
jgi:peroxiredoxin